MTLPRARQQRAEHAGRCAVSHGTLDRHSMGTASESQVTREFTCVFPQQLRDSQVTACHRHAGTCRLAALRGQSQRTRQVQNFK